MPELNATPEVSVIICVRNGAATIRRQLAALDRQIDHPPFEIVVVDNGSTDSTRSLVTAWIGGRQSSDTSARVVVGPHDPSIPRTRNAGAIAARGRVLAFCDADDEVDERWVGAMAAAVTGDMLVGGRILARDADRTPRPDVLGDGLIVTRYLPHVSGCNWAIARRAYLAVGGFDESLPSYGFDDVDFSWRLQEAGFAIGYAPAAAVHFTVSDSGASVKKRLLLGRGRVLMAFRYPKYDPERYTILRTVRDVAVALWALGRDAARSRKLPRSRLGHVIALAGRVWGAVLYRSGRRLPERRLLSVPPPDEGPRDRSRAPGGLG